jgi:hypothetical protein
MSNNGIGVRDSLTRRLAEAERDRFHRRVTPIVDCIRKMRAEGFADNENAGLFRHAADELDARRRTTKSSPPLKFKLSNYCFRNSSGSLAMFTRIVVNKRPPALSLVGGGCQGPRSICSGGRAAKTLP